MKILSTQKTSTFLLITAVVLSNGMVPAKTYAQEVDLDTFCQKSPLNSRCQGYKPSSQGEGTAEQNSQTIRLKLKTSSSDSEWILIEKSATTVKLAYTTQSKRRRGFLGSVLGFLSPVPLPNLGSRKRTDRLITKVVFEPDSCSLAQRLKQSEDVTLQISQPSNFSSCILTGTDTLNLPEGTDIYNGRFTIEYQEGDLTKTIMFRVPIEEQQRDEKR